MSNNADNKNIRCLILIKFIQEQSLIAVLILILHTYTTYLLFCHQFQTYNGYFIPFYPFLCSRFTNKSTLVKNGVMILCYYCVFSATIFSMVTFCSPNASDNGFHPVSTHSKNSLLRNDITCSLIQSCKTSSMCDAVRRNDFLIKSKSPLGNAFDNRFSTIRLFVSVSVLLLFHVNKILHKSKQH